MRLYRALGLVSLLGSVALCAQTPDAAPPDASVPTITARSNLVVVPALVRDKSGAVVYTMKAEDFHLTDDGIDQPLHLQEDTGGEPLALVVVIENGSDGINKLDEYGHLPTYVDNFVGAVPHRIAVVSFDGSPVIEQAFTSNDEAVARGIANIVPGDRNDAILDALKFSLDMLRKQPVNYRRAILLISETVDHGSQTALGDAVREVSDTNTIIYAVSFSSTRSETKEEAKKLLPGILTHPDPGPKKGCFSRDPDDPNVDLTQSRAAQDWECAQTLILPLRLASLAYKAAVSGLAKNVPETVTRLTGGEYFNFHNQKGLEQDLFNLANHVPNRYVLTFQPSAPHPGPHVLALTLPSYPQLHLSAREGYWVEENPAPAAPTPVQSPSPPEAP